jgi:hypothetical protein
LLSWHCGQVLRGGTDSVHALARRLRLLDFEVFFFGTAIFSGLSLGVQLSACSCCQSAVGGIRPGGAGNEA